MISFRLPVELKQEFDAYRKVRGLHQGWALIKLIREHLCAVGCQPRGEKEQ